MKLSTRRMIIVILFLILITLIIWGFKDKVKRELAPKEVKYKQYVVQASDTELWGIVKRECQGDIRYNIYLVREKNKINPDQIYTGQKLYLPVKNGFYK